MKLYISAVIQNSGSVDCRNNVENVVDLSKLHILQSYIYAEEKYAEKFSHCKDFMMDSGAFTIMMGKKKFDIVAFTKQYAEFLKKWNIKQFIELDVDSVYGIDVYKDCLHILQDITGADPLRVFHMWRGKEYFEELTKQKDYICIGGLAGTDSNCKYVRQNLDWFIKTAHKNNCKIHGLGIGNISDIRKYDFDSVDSANWTNSIRFGHLYRFNGHEICKYDGSFGCSENERISTNFAGCYSLKEWAKFSHYIDSL